jgi:hypothetical protein
MICTNNAVIMEYDAGMSRAEAEAVAWPMFLATALSPGAAIADAGLMASNGVAAVAGCDGWYVSVAGIIPLGCVTPTGGGARN